MIHWISRLASYWQSCRCCSRQPGACGCVVLLCERLHHGPSTAYTGWSPVLAQSAIVVAAAAGGAGGAGAPVAVWFCSLRDCTQALSTAESPLLRLALLFSDSGHAACNSSHP